MEYLRKNYRFGLDGWGAALFLAVMLPNIFWFAVPAPNDILRQPAAGGLLDAAAGTCQPLIAVTLAGVINSSRLLRKGLGPLDAAAFTALACYYGAWAVYYRGIAAPPVVLALVVFPCAALLSYAIGRKNGVAVVPTVIFTICHLISSIRQFII